MQKFLTKEHHVMVSAVITETIQAFFFKCYSCSLKVGMSSTTLVTVVIVVQVGFQNFDFSASVANKDLFFQGFLQNFSVVCNVVGRIRGVQKSPSLNQHGHSFKDRSRG